MTQGHRPAAGVAHVASRRHPLDGHRPLWPGRVEPGDPWRASLHDRRRLGGRPLLRRGPLLRPAPGYYPRLDNVLMRVMDGLMAFPGIILAIALMASVGPSLVKVIVAGRSWSSARRPTSKPPA